MVETLSGPNYRNDRKYFLDNVDKFRKMIKFIKSIKVKFTCNF